MRPFFNNIDTSIEDTLFIKHVNINYEGEGVNALFKKVLILLIAYSAVFSHEAMPVVRVFTARNIVTMNPNMPQAKAVAVKDGKILGVGTLDSLQPWLKRSAYVIDTRFAHDVIVPGFIEAHMHPQVAGLLWQAVYVGRFDRHTPGGVFTKGLKTKQAVLAKIKDAVKRKEKTGAKNGWIFAWGYQPEFYNNEPLTVDDLDPITGPYDIMVENASMHLYYVNSSVLKKMDVTPKSDISGIVVKDGKLTGQLEEIKAIKRLLPYLPKVTMRDLEKITRDAAQLAQRVGVTTMADAALGYIPKALKAYQHETAKDDFPVRVVLFPAIDMVKANGGVSYLQKMYAQNNNMLSFGPVKFLLDGSLQGYTGNLRWPYYLNGKNGIANMTFDEVKEDLLMIHKAGYQAALHANGDQATQDAINAIQYALNIAPRFDHRHRLEHNQLVNEAQLVCMKTLGITTNLFVNHVYYWGDLYAKSILGYERANRIDPAGSALKHGVKFAFHSDASVTPVDPLKTIWIATTRKTLSGKVLGPEQRISTYDALKAVTIDAAYLLFQDGMKGSIEVGKFADFAVLDRNPLEVPADDVQHIKVKATILGGKAYVVS